jgi:hypothetical protein
LLEAAHRLQLLVSMEQHQRAALEVLADQVVDVAHARSGRIARVRLAGPPHIDVVASARLFQDLLARRGFAEVEVQVHNGAQRWRLEHVEVAPPPVG